MTITTVEKIKNTALKLFAQRGPAATSISDVAKKAGISAGLMYRYYKSKDELYSVLVKEATGNAETSVRQAIELSESPAQQIKTITQDFIRELSSNTSLGASYYLLMTQVLINPEFSSIEKKHLKQMYEPLNLICEIIEKGQKSGEIRDGNPFALTIMYLSAFNGLSSYKLMMGNKFAVPDSDWINRILIVEQFIYSVESKEIYIHIES